MAKILSVKTYHIGAGIQLNCVGEAYKLKAFESYFDRTTNPTIGGILACFQLLEIYCYPWAPLQRSRFLERFQEDLAEIARFLTMELYDEAANVVYGKNHYSEIGATAEDFQSYYQNTEWYKNGWRI